MRKKIILTFLIWRALLLIPLYLGRSLIPYRLHQEYTNLWYFIKPYPPINNYLIFPWANFDGVHYLNIAANGYSTNARFLPLFPLLIRYFSQIFGQINPFRAGQFIIALSLSNLFFLLSLIIFYKLIRLDYPQKISFSSLIFFLIFPTSFFFVSVYAESLFLFLALLSFYAARKRYWLWAGVFGMLLTITRLPGISILPALIYEFYTQEKKITNKIVSFAIIPLGLLSYGWFNLKKWGDFFYFIKAHGELGNSRSTTSIILFPQTIFRYFKILTHLSLVQFEWWIAFLELATFILVGYLLYFAFKNRVRLSYLIFALFCFLMPTFSGTFSGLPRYAAVLFPIFIVLGGLRNKQVKIALRIIFIFLLAILLLFFSRGYFIA